MKQLVYTLFLFAAIFFYTGCSKSAPAGTNGTQGKQGVQGQDLIGFPREGLLHFPSAGGPFYSDTIGEFNYNDSTMVTAYVTMNDTNWYKLPYYNMYSSGDELLCSSGNGYLIMWYFNSSASFPADAIVTYKVLIVPNQSTP